MIDARTRRNTLANGGFGIARILSSIRAWHVARRDRHILDSLSAEQLKDIGYRRYEGNPPHYEPFGGGWQ